MVPCKSTAEEVSFEWSHHRISLADSKVETKLHISITVIIDSEIKRVISPLTLDTASFLNYHHFFSGPGIFCCK